MSLLSWLHTKFALVWETEHRILSFLVSLVFFLFLFFVAAPRRVKIWRKVPPGIVLLNNGLRWFEYQQYTGFRESKMIKVRATLHAIKWVQFSEYNIEKSRIILRTWTGSQLNYHVARQAVCTLIVKSRKKTNFDYGKYSRASHRACTKINWTRIGEFVARLPQLRQRSSVRFVNALKQRRYQFGATTIQPNSSIRKLANTENKKGT